jgi:uncharacterized protein involved in outer membrane biogenesis
MENVSRRRIFYGLAIAVGCFIGAAVLFALLFDWNWARPGISRAIGARIGRPVSIDGNLRVHLLSFTPNATVEEMKIGNPPWAEQPLMVELPRLTFAVSLGELLSGHLVFTQVLVSGPKVDLERDTGGRASWEFGDDTGKPESRGAAGQLPAIRQLDIDDGRIRILDRTRKLSLTGTLRANEDQGGEGGFQFKAEGSLNAKPFSVSFSGGPLINATPGKPYSFESHILAGSITLDSKVRIDRPFDLTATTAEFTLAGNDLADGYYLTGLALPNTPPYRLQATLRRDGTDYRVENLLGRLGSSDISGELALDSGGKRPKLTGRLVSKSLNFADLAAPLGAPVKTTLAAGAARDSEVMPSPPPGDSPSAPAGAPAGAAGGASKRLLPDADLQVNRVRGMDADVTFAADRVVEGKLPLEAVRLHVILDDGLLRLDPIAFVLPQGQIVGSARIDARATPPQSGVELQLDQLDLGQFKSAKSTSAPLAGKLAGRVQLRGAGASVHKFASTANGSVSMVIEQGEISQALAELTGINVARGLGLLLAKDEKHDDIRCGVANFQVRNGVLGVNTLVLDTTDVLITGKGDANLGTERLDLSIQGKPKKLRLVRLRTPITVHGTLEKPSIGVSPEKVLAQAGAATALGVVLTPVAAALAFVDPGLAKDANCAALTGNEARDIKPPDGGRARPAAD